MAAQSSSGEAQVKTLMSVLALLASATAAPAWSEWYVGSGLGVANSHLGGTSGGVALASRDARNTSFKLLAGYQFTPNWGVEAQYADLGRFGYNACAGAACGSGSVTVSQWSLAATGTLPLANNYFLTGKLGASRNAARGGTFCAGAVCGASAGGSRSDLLAGIGVGYHFTRNISMRLEYEHFGKVLSGDGFAARGDNWAATLRYTF